MRSESRRRYAPGTCQWRAVLISSVLIVTAINNENGSMKDAAERELIVFTEALKVPVQERAAFLERACAGDENLRRKVEALLTAHGRVGDFLEQPPGGPSV